MTGVDGKEDLHSYLRGARETLVWKLDGLGEYDMRRPLTATGTNLLGLVKHSAGTQLRYFGMVFGRAADVSLPWQANVEPNADFWAAPDEISNDIVAFYRRTWEIADETIASLPLDAIGHVPWWGADGTVTLHRVLVHVTAETQRHAGHADIVRELIDGAVGRRPEDPNIPDIDWPAYRERLEAAALAAAATRP